jgi:hypothetical protein
MIKSTSYQHTRNTNRTVQIIYTAIKNNFCVLLTFCRSPFHTLFVYFVIGFKYQPEDRNWRVETCSWLAYYFDKVVFLTVGKLP